MHSGPTCDSVVSSSCSESVCSGVQVKSGMFDKGLQARRSENRPGKQHAGKGQYDSENLRDASVHVADGNICLMLGDRTLHLFT